MAIKEVPTYQYRKYKFGGNVKEFDVKCISSDIVLESDDFKVIMDFDSFVEIREKINSVYEELM